MDFNDTPEEAEYRAKARAWLDDNAELRSPGVVHDAGENELDLVERTKAWRRKKHAAGYMGITYPTEYGGAGGTQIQEIIYNQEESRYIAPKQVASSLGLIIPTLLTYMTEEQKQRYVPAILKGEEIWCQLFSEPAAGSDLAGLRTRSQKEGDEWVINGQKIWNSGAHLADFGILVTRSDPTAAKHKGLTYFFIDMKTPGIDVRPIKQVTGEAHFNEVFFDNVRIPDTCRLGDIGEGWQVAITTLMNERVVAGERPPPDFEEAFDLARTLGLDQDAAVRSQLADWYVQTRGVKLTRMRSISALSRGDRPGPENSICKLVSTWKRQEIALTAMDWMDAGGISMDPDETPMRGLFEYAMLDAPRGRIAAGTDEILRNIIAERVLRLPQDVRIDKNVPFNDLISGTVTK